MTKIETYKFGQELSEKLNHEIDISNVCSILDNETNRTTIETLADIGIGHIPDNERLDHIEIRVDPFDVPKVTIWCYSEGFSYENSRMFSDRYMVNGRGKDVMIDIRPF